MLKLEEFLIYLDLLLSTSMKIFYIKIKRIFIQAYRFKEADSWQFNQMYSNFTPTTMFYSVSITIRKAHKVLAIVKNVGCISLRITGKNNLHKL